MKNYKWFMGIDVSKGKLDITVLEGGEKALYELIANDHDGLEGFIKRLKELRGFSWGQCLVCAEHTGIYNSHLLSMAEKHNWQLCLESGMQIKQSGGVQRGKNDIVDSYRIALYACKNAAYIKLWEPTRAVMATLQHLSALRYRLINVRKQLATPLKESKGFVVARVVKLLAKCNESSLVALDNDIKATEEEIKKAIASDATLKRLFAVVSSVPGIGAVAAVEMILTTGEFKRISDPRKYACYSGVAPFEHTSGSSIRGRTRTSKKANQHVKSILHMCSIVAIRCSPDIEAYYKRKVGEKKHKMCVLNAVKNKLIHRVFACVNEDRCYDKTYVKKDLPVS